MLLAHHQKLIDDSAISTAVAQSRGYWSATKKSEIKDLGFSDQQCRVPALVVPVYDVTGGIALHQIRPNNPRTGSDGKQVKYETPSKARIALDVPPSIREQLGNPHRPLFLTEGVRKADSALSHGLVCIDILGVWNFRGTNDQGGKTILAAWEYIHLKNREVYIVFDSDVMLKPEVYKALVRVKAFLESRGALVRVIYLEPKLDGAKVGLDDFFAAGYTVAALLANATDKLRPGPEPEHEFPYKETPHGLVWLKPTRDGVMDTPLCNFTAHISGDVIEDDGVERKRTFEIEASQGERCARLKVSAERFASMNWTAEALGSHAILAPGPNVKDHARVAIQLFSQETEERVVYSHTGWRRIQDRWIYLHAGGAIGAEGAVSGVDVALPAALERYTLPHPPAGEEVQTAIRASLHFLTVAPSTITMPLLCALYRAVLGDSDFSLHISGKTGQGKTALAALCQQHFGSTLDARHLPASWSSTGNSLEATAFVAKDALLTVDDFAPCGNAAQVQRMHAEADRLLRAQGNQAGRQRMRADTTLKPAKPPRGLILSTGEDVPKGESLRSRLFTLEVAPGDVCWPVLATCQDNAACGLYAASLAGFIQWLAGHYEEVKTRLRTDIDELRREAVQSPHKRTSDIVANLLIGFQYFLRFAREQDAISIEEEEEYWTEAGRAIAETARSQSAHQNANEPARRFLELLIAALAGGRAHIASTDGREPEESGAWGWRSEPGQIERQPKGERIGWIEDANVYLDSDNAYAVAQRLLRDQGDSIPITLQTLRKRLKEQNFLASWDDASESILIRRTCEGQSRRVLHLNKDIILGLSPPTKKPSKPGNSPDSPEGAAEKPSNEAANPANPATGPARETQGKSNGYDQNAGFAGFATLNREGPQENNNEAGFSPKNPAGFAGFSENKNPATTEENPATDQDWEEFDI
jgi:Domain of unknown function (DUF3854)/Domain of unknown function (DUF927)